MVIIPPIPAAKAIGINCRDAEILATEQIPKITGNNAAAVPVFDNTDDMSAVTTITANINEFSPVPAFLTTVVPIVCAKPV